MCHSGSYPHCPPLPSQVYQELVRLDEQELNNRYKIGVIYCKRGQTMEEEMYNNGGWTAAPIM